MYHYPDGENHKKERYMDKDMKRPRENESERDDTNSSDAFVNYKRMKLEDADEGYPTIPETSDYEEIQKIERVQEENAEQIQQEFEECLKDIKQDEKENMMSNTYIDQIEGATHRAEDEDETAENKEEEVWWQKFDEKKESEDDKEDEISIIDNGNDVTQPIDEEKEDYNVHIRQDNFGILT